MRVLIKNADIALDNEIIHGNILIDNDTIVQISPHAISTTANYPVNVTFNAKGKLVMPGVIDSHVHFREPGLTHKANIHSESMAAVAGGVTSFMDMPNTVPQTTTNQALAEKFEIARQSSLANYSFYIGATNDNLAEILHTNFHECCGVKLFLGSSTGNMLVNDKYALEQLFTHCPAIICVHAEDEATIARNLKTFKARYGENIPWTAHAMIRSREACLIASQKAVELARQHNTKLHILHISTEEELALLKNEKVTNEKITGEACVAHLWFKGRDYGKLRSLIKVNPSIKQLTDREALRQAVKDGVITTISTDHAPHTLEEKQQDYLHAPSGAPMIAHSLPAMLELFDPQTVVEKMCHAQARLFGVEKRGFIREGYKADLVIVEKDYWTVGKKTTFYKCGWTPMQKTMFSNRVYATFVNGQVAYFNGKIDETVRGEQLHFVECQ